MPKRYPISDARAKLPELVDAVVREPGTVYQITRRGKVVAELRAPQPAAAQGSLGAAVLRLASRERGKPKSRIQVATRKSEVLAELAGQTSRA